MISEQAVSFEWKFRSERVHCVNYSGRSIRLRAKDLVVVFLINIFIFIFLYDVHVIGDPEATIIDRSLRDERWINFVLLVKYSVGVFQHIFLEIKIKRKSHKEQSGLKTAWRGRT